MLRKPGVSLQPKKVPGVHQLTLVYNLGMSKQFGFEVFFGRFDHYGVILVFLMFELLLGLSIWEGSMTSFINIYYDAFSLQSDRLCFYSNDVTELNTFFLTKKSSSEFFIYKAVKHRC